MAFQQNLFQKAYCFINMTGPAIVRPASSEFGKRPKSNVRRIESQTVGVKIGRHKLWMSVKRESTLVGIFIANGRTLFTDLPHLSPQSLDGHLSRADITAMAPESFRH